MEINTRAKRATPKAIMSFVFMVLLLYYKMKLTMLILNAIVFMILRNNMTDLEILMISGILCAMEAV